MIKACVADFSERHSKGNISETRTLDFMHDAGLRSGRSSRAWSACVAVMCHWQCALALTSGCTVGGAAAVQPTVIPSGSGQQTLTYLIPSVCAGNFIGKGGANIHKIRDGSEASVGHSISRSRMELLSRSHLGATSTRTRLYSAIPERPCAQLDWH